MLTDWIHHIDVFDQELRRWNIAATARESPNGQHPSEQPGNAPRDAVNGPCGEGLGLRVGVFASATCGVFNDTNRVWYRSNNSLRAE